MGGARPRRDLGPWLPAALSAAALAASSLWSPSEFPKLQLCWLRRWTDISCPGCGLTRSFCALSHGDLAAAWSYHPFGIVLYALAIAFLLWPIVAGRWPGLGAGLRRSRVLLGVGVGLLVAFLAHGVLRAAGELVAGP